jgi:hypothetical protein
MYTLPAGSSYVAGSSTYDVSGFVDFFLTGCSANGQSNCVLNVELDNTQTGTEVANQVLSGITFELSNAGTALLKQGSSLNSTITSSPGSGSVTTIAQSNGALGSTSGVGAWKLQQHPNNSPTWGSGSGGAGGVNFTLDNSPGATTSGLIVTPGSGGAGAPGTDSSFSSFSPSYMGPVYFQITGISGLTSSTDVSDISLLFGDSGASTSPTGYVSLSSSNCTAFGPGSCTNGLIGYQPVPEPVSFLLAGSGLLALVCLMRRRRSVFAE